MLELGWCNVLTLTYNNITKYACLINRRNPTPNNTATPIWLPAHDFPLDYLQIGNENGKFDSEILQSRVDFYSHRANFWMELRNEHRISSWLEEGGSGGGSSSTYSHISLKLVGVFLSFLLLDKFLVPH